MSETTGFEADIKALAALLEAEIEEIRAGELGGIEPRLAEKQALAARLEAAGAGIDAALAAEPDGALRAKLDALAALIARDAQMLERMQQVTRDLGRDFKRLRDRHGLGGLYGADGNRSARDTLSRASMDKSV